MKIIYNPKGLITSDFYLATTELVHLLPDEYKNKWRDVISEFRLMVKKSKADEIRVEHINNNPVDLTLIIKRL